MHDWAMEHEMDMDMDSRLPIFDSRFFAEPLDPAEKKCAEQSNREFFESNAMSGYLN